jgi:hypothetical protein
MLTVLREVFFPKVHHPLVANCLMVLAEVGLGWPAPDGELSLKSASNEQILVTL